MSTTPGPLRSTAYLSTASSRAPITSLPPIGSRSTPPTESGFLRPGRNSSRSSENGTGS